MGAALTGALGGGGGSEPEAQQQVSAPVSQQPSVGGGGGRAAVDNSNTVCRFELQQFLECSQTQHDLSLCQGFSEALKDCRRLNGEFMLFSLWFTSVKMEI